MMNITLSFMLEDYESKHLPEGYGYELGERDPQDLLLTPQELGDAFVAFLKALDAKEQLMDPIIRLPYHNDDSEDIFAVIQRGMSQTRIIPYVEMMDQGHTRVIESHT
jgi:hypothetical protein